MQAFPVIQEVKLLTWTPANVYRLRYRPRLWGSWLDRMEAYIEADSAAEAVRILREELRGLFDCVEIIARYRAQCNFGGVPVNGGRVPVGAAERAAVHRWQLSPREKELQKLLGGREIRR